MTIERVITTAILTKKRITESDLPDQSDEFILSELFTILDGEDQNIIKTGFDKFMEYYN